MRSIIASWRKRLSKRQTRRTFEKTFDEVSSENTLKYLFLEVTRRCNLECVYCGSDCHPKWKGDELPVEKWIEALEQIAEDYPAKKVMVAVTGGEPLLKPGIFDLFAALANLDFPFGMVTNGTTLSPKMAKKVVDSKIGSISISLDAPPKVNDSLRGEGTTEKIERGIKNLLDAGYQGKLEIISTLTKPAVPHLDDLRRYISTLRVPMWRLVPVMPIGRAAERRELVPDNEDLKTILEYVRVGRTDKWLPKPEFGEECYLGDDYEEVVRPYKFLCRAGLNVAGILYDGAIGACPELPRDFVQGHLKTDRFSDVWENRYQMFRDRKWTKRGPCVECDSFNVCQGGSLHLYHSADSDISRCFYVMLQDQA